MIRQANAMALIFAMAFLVGCRSEETGDFFRFDGRLFVFNYRVATATYLINIKQLRTLEPGHVAVVSFENPAGGPPLVVRESIYPNTTRTTINSPPVFCIIKDRPYRVTVRIESADGTLGRPGMVMISPVTTTTNSAPAERRSSRTGTM